MDDIYIRCSALYHITPQGKDYAGLTDNQAQYLEDLIKKEESSALTEKQQERLDVLSDKQADCSITNKQLDELNNLLLKRKSPRLTQKQQSDKLQLIAKRDYKPDFDLSEGAKSYIHSLVEPLIYGYTKKIVSTLATQKGEYCEPDAIELYRNVNFRKKEYCKKNTTRFSSNFLTGEVDIYQQPLKLITDTKIAETWESFPSLPFQVEKIAKNGGYIDQGHGYMKLWNENGLEVENYEVAYCMIETPEHLIPEWEDDISRHLVSDDIPLSLCLTTYSFERDIEREKYIQYKCQEANNYAKWYFNAITNKF